MINIRRLLSPALGVMLSRSLLQTPPRYSFVFMSLFEQPKRPQQLSSVFKKPTRIKGHLRSKSRKGYISPKLNTKVGRPKQRLANHSGMLKRVKIVGPRWNRQFKRLSANNYHLKRKKSGQNLRRKSRAQYISQADITRVKRMLPYFKRRSLKKLH